MEMTELIGKRCRVTNTGQEVWVLGIQYEPDRDRYWAHIDGEGISRGTEVNAKFLEVIA